MPSTYTVHCPHFHCDVTEEGVAEVRFDRDELPELVPCDACRAALPAILSITVESVEVAATRLWCVMCGSQLAWCPKARELDRYRDRC